MKKVLEVFSAITLVMVLVSPSQAQNASLGFKAGLNFASLHGSDFGSANVGTITRLVGGAFVTVGSGTLGFQPELLYAQKGNTDTEGTATGKIKISYIEVPMLLRISPSSAEMKHVNFVVGPAFAFRASCTVDMSDSGGHETGDCADSLLPVKSFDYGLVLGVGGEIPLSRAALVLDARFDGGLAKIDDSTHKYDVKNKAFSLTAGVKFPLGSKARVAAR